MASEKTVHSPGALPDAEVLYARLLAGVRQEISKTPAANTWLVGIHSGGAWLAERLQRDLGLDGPVSTLNVSFYRDDFHRIGLHSNSQAQPSAIQFPVAGAHVILVDDVLYTGRTIRAAMNELFDYGRPDSIRLAVLLDRGGRELPVAACVVAASIPLPPESAFVLSRQDDGKFSLALEKDSVHE